VPVGDGRGFVVEEKPGLCLYPKRYVVTAAHCLPTDLLTLGFGGTWGSTLRDLLSKLGEEPSVWAECIFVDPIADIAVLCEPDNQELGEQAEAYEALTEAATSLALGRAIPWGTTVPVSLIALDGHRIAGKAKHLGDRLWIEFMLKYALESGKIKPPNAP
jgi:hypothetical protein